MFSPFFWIRVLPWWAFVLVSVWAVQVGISYSRSAALDASEVETALQGIPPQPTDFADFDPDTLDTAMHEFSLVGFDQAALSAISLTRSALVFFADDRPGDYLVFTAVGSDELEAWMNDFAGDDTYVVHGFSPSTVRSIYNRDLVDALEQADLPEPRQLIFASAMIPDRNTALEDSVERARFGIVIIWTIGLTSTAIAAFKFRRRETNNANVL